MERILRGLLSCGVMGEGKLHRYIELEVKREIDHNVFHNLLPMHVSLLPREQNVLHVKGVIV